METQTFSAIFEKVSTFGLGAVIALILLVFLWRLIERHGAEVRELNVEHTRETRELIDTHAEEIKRLNLLHADEIKRIDERYISSLQSVTNRQVTQGDRMIDIITAYTQTQRDLKNSLDAVYNYVRLQSEIRAKDSGRGAG